MRRLVRNVGALAVVALGGGVLGQGGRQQVAVTVQQSGTSALLIAVSPVNDRVVWVAGADRTILRTTDGGATWTARQVPVADGPRLQFRDIHGVDADTAYALTIGKGSDSRVFKTTDGGMHWTQPFTNPDTAAFYDCLGFWDANRGLMIGDEVDGEIMMLETHDGADHWSRVPSASLPAAIQGEGSFASSGTCLVTRPGGRAWVSTTKARVLRTADYGRTWTVSKAPITVDDSTGVPSVSFRDDRHGMAFGGYGAAPNDTLVAVTGDGGATWTVRARTPMRGGIWGGTYVPGTAGSVVAVGATGAAYSRDDGRTWTQLDSLDYWGIGFATGDAGWIVGRGGRIVKLSGF